MLALGMAAPLGGHGLLLVAQDPRQQDTGAWRAQWALPTQVTLLPTVDPHLQAGPELEQALAMDLPVGVVTSGTERSWHHGGERLVATGPPTALYFRHTGATLLVYRVRAAQ